MKTSQMTNRAGQNYTFTGKKGSGLIANQTVVELRLKKGDQMMALSDETFRDQEGFVRTSLGEIPSKYFFAS